MECSGNTMALHIQQHQAMVNGCLIFFGCSTAQRIRLETHTDICISSLLPRRYPFQIDRMNEVGLQGKKAYTKANRKLYLTPKN